RRSRGARRGVPARSPRRAKPPFTLGREPIVAPMYAYWQRSPRATRTAGGAFVCVTPSENVSPITNGTVFTVSLASVWKAPAAGFVAVTVIVVATRFL